VDDTIRGLWSLKFASSADPRIRSTQVPYRVRLMLPHRRFLSSRHRFLGIFSTETFVAGERTFPPYLDCKHDPPFVRLATGSQINPPTPS